MISVIMNTYNENPKFLKQAIKSILFQKDVDIHLILSTVENDISIKNHKDNNNIDFCISPQPGIYNQINNAISKIQGEWFCYVSSNDFYLPRKLIDEKNICEKQNKLVCYSSYYKTNENLKIIRQKKLKNYNYHKHLKSNFVSDVALVKSELLLEHAPFKIEYGNYAFWDLWLRIAESKGEDVFAYNPRPEWYYRITNNSRHIRKRKNKEWMQKENNDKQKMLQEHKNA